MASIYGLVDAPATWNKCFNDVLLNIGFKRFENEVCLYIYPGKYLQLVLFVDDVIIIGKNKQSIAEIVKEIQQRFQVKISWNPVMFVGLQIFKDVKCVYAC